MNICDKCKNYYPNNHYCQYWDCDVTIQHETCCGFANMTNADRIRTMSDNGNLCCGGAKRRQDTTELTANIQIRRARFLHGYSSQWNQ